MKMLKRLIKIHRFLFAMAVLFTASAIIFNLCWNRFLAGMLDALGDADAVASGNGMSEIYALLPIGIAMILLHTISEYLSSYLASYTCEMFAHEMRMGYAGYYLRSDIQKLSKLNVGEVAEYCKRLY